jgi:tetratricopeptide (TPR) repeat protein/adenylate kinase family enzyme/DNA-binding MarR family transcriptional regulator
MEYAKYENQFEVPFAISQEGIASAIGIRRDNIPRAMKDLKAAGLVTEKVARVEGVYRKRKVYFLTDHGFQYIHELKSKILSTEISIIHPDGHKENVKVSEMNTRFRPHRPLGLIEIINRISDDNSLELKILTEGMEYPSRRSRMGPEVSSSHLREGSEYIEEIDEAPMRRYFVGRTKELNKILNWFDTGDHKIAVIYGIPGIGKTTLANRVLSEYQGQKHMFWYRFHRWDTMRSILLPFSEFLAKMQRKRLKSYLSGKHSLDLNNVSQILEDELDNSKTLLIFDDFQRVKEDIAEFFSLLIEILSRIKGVHVMIVGRRIMPFYDRSDVVVKKLVAELQLDGLDESSSRQLLKLKNIDDKLFKKIYELTKGHPLFLELISSVKDITDKKDIKRYIYEEIFSNLLEQEKILMNILSVFRYPVTSRAVFIEDDMDIEVLDELVERNLVQEIAYDMYDIHDLIREFFYIRLPPNIRKRYHLEASDYYIEDGSTLASIEAQYHFLKAGEFEKAASLAVANGDEIINKGYLEEFMNIIEDFSMNNTPETYWADIMLLKAEVLTITGDLDTALEYYNQALMLSDSSKIPLVKAKTLRKIGHISRTRSDLKSAEKNFNDSLKISKQIKDNQGIADIYRGLGEIYGIKGEFEKAIEYLLKGLDYAQTSEDLQVLAKAYVDLGTVYGNMGDHDKAIEYHEKCISVLEETGDQYSMAKVMNNLGVVYLDKGESDKALKHFEDCIRLSRTTGDIRQMGYGLTNASEIYIYQSNFNQAKEYLDESIKIFNKIGDKFKLAGAFCNYGVIFSKQHDWEKAIDQFSKGISILEKLHHSYYLAKKYLDFGKIFKAKKDKSNATKYINKAKEIFKRLGIKYDDNIYIV